MPLGIFPPIRYLPSTSKSGLGSIVLQCYVYPNASRQSLQGISFASASAIKVHLAVPPKDNLANHALIEILSKALHWPKSDVNIIHGEKSREKAVSFAGVDAKGDVEAVINEFKARLRNAATN